MLRRGNVVEDGVDGLFRVVPRDGALDVGQQLFVLVHHGVVVVQPEVDLDHLLEGFEAPLSLLTLVLQLKDSLK